MPVMVRMRTILPWHLPGMMIGFATLTVPTAAQQVAAPSDRHLNFDIPAQPLDNALAQYFRLTNVQLLYNSKATSGRRSSPVKGSYTARTALQLMLAGTGLAARYGGSDIVFIDAIGAGEQGASVPLGRVVVRERSAGRLSSIDRLAYHERIRAELEDRLKADSRVNMAHFSITLTVRIAHDGKVTVTAISLRSGARGLSAILQRIVSEAAVSAPPAGLPQPLTISLTGRR